NILPEQIAHKRHHPQFEAIRTLCLLSLVFGGLLWPLAWIWAYSKPVMYKLAYGTDKHVQDEEYAREGGRAQRGAPRSAWRAWGRRGSRMPTSRRSPPISTRSRPRWQEAATRWKSCC